MPTEEEVKQLAYAIWEREGRPQDEAKKHYFTAKRILETRERRALMSPRKMLIVDDRLIDKLDENRGDVSRAEFVEFCLDRCLEELQTERDQSEEKRADEREFVTKEREESVSATRREFQEFKRNVRDLITTYLDFVTEHRPEPRAGGATQEDLDRLKRRLRAIAGEA